MRAACDASMRIPPCACATGSHRHIYQTPSVSAIFSPLTTFLPFLALVWTPAHCLVVKHFKCCCRSGMNLYLNFITRRQQTANIPSLYGSRTYHRMTLHSEMSEDGITQQRVTRWHDITTCHKMALHSNMSQDDITQQHVTRWHHKLTTHTRHSCPTCSSQTLMVRTWLTSSCPQKDKPSL